MKKWLSVLSLGILLMSCVQERNQDNNYEFVIFGLYNGFCIENCSTIFKMENGQLYEDDVNQVIGYQDIFFKDTPMAETAFDKAAFVEEELPQELLQTETNTFGCPGCVDQDILLLVLKMNGEVREITIDPYASDLPAYLSPYVKKLLEVIDELKE